MRCTFLDAEFPAHPYPGATPGYPFVHVDGRGYRLQGADGSWAVAEVPLDDWLAQHGAEPLDARRYVLAYGSNACPAKISWLREVHGLEGPVVVLRVETLGLAAVWAAGRRLIDDQRPATLAAAPGVREEHAVWLATADQVEALDRCEGRGDRYDLAELRTSEIRLADGRRLTGVLAYVGRREIRMPLLVQGSPVRCADIGQDEARHLGGVPAAGDGLDRDVLRVDGLRGEGLRGEGLRGDGLRGDGLRGDGLRGDGLRGEGPATGLRRDDPRRHALRRDGRAT